MIKNFILCKRLKIIVWTKTNHTSIIDCVRFVFTIMDTNEDVEIIGSWKRSDDDSYYSVLYYGF